MGGFSKSQTTKNKTKPSAQGKDFVNSLVNLATKTAKQPLKQYTGPRVAGFTPDQTAGMNAVRAAQGVQTPYINTAAQYAAQGANPITGIPNVGTSSVNWNAIGDPQQVQYNGYTPDQFSAEGLAQFYNPYQQNVIDSTLQNIARADSLQQGDLLGKAISSGASPFGGDRAGLAAAELARGQSMARNQTVAELQNQGFNTALGAYQNQQGLNAQAGLQNASNALSASQQNAANWMAQQQANQNAGLTASQQNAANQLTASQQNAGNALTAAQANQAAAARAAEQFGGLGTQAQQQALTGASALLQTGGLQQQLEQNRIDIPYQQFQEQQQYPQQQAQWLLNTLMGVPATSWGTTSTTQQPGPSGLSQIIGGATALGSLGLGFNRGGVADYADGGAVSYAPAANYGIAIPMLDQSAFTVDQNAGYKGEALPGYTYSKQDYPPIVTRLPKNMRKAIKGIGSSVGYSGSQGAAYGSDEWASQGGPGALIWREIAKGLQGGILGKQQGYKKKKASGGGIDDEEPAFSLNPLGDIRIPQPAGLAAAIAPVEDAHVVAEYPPAGRNTIRIPTDRPVMAAAAPPPVADPAMGIDIGMPPAGMPEAAAGGDRGASRFSQFLESPAGALFQGSLATLAGESPFAGVNIGNGLLTGVQAYQAAQGDRDPQVITREDGSVHLLYPDSGEVVEVMGALPGAVTKVTPYTEAAKARQDLDAGFITPEQYDAIIAGDPAKRPTPNSDLAKAKADLDAGYITQEQYDAMIEGGNSGDPATIANITTIRKEYEAQPGTSRYRTAVPILTSMMANVETNTAMSDLDFVYGMGKIFDPTSTILMGEMGLVLQGQSIPEQLQGQLQRILSGEAAITDQARRDLIEAARARVNEYRTQAEAEAQYYADLSSGQNINPMFVVRPLEPLPLWDRGETPPPASTPAIPSNLNPGETYTLPDGTIIERVD